MSPELNEALTEWLNWVERGAPLGEPFERDSGLCWVIPISLRDELKLLFIGDGLCGAYPFGMDDFDKRFHRGKMHECPKRLAWVREKLGRTE